MAAYLFAHFTSEQADGEQVYFSVSKDGLHFEDLNHGKPILRSQIGEEGVRDPFIIRDPKKGKFYLIATDLRLSKGLGWQHAVESGSLDLIIWESTDLINWQGPNSVHVGVEGAGNVWAPEAIYDQAVGKILVFWASRVAGKQRMYASYTTDFDKFEKPFLFIDHSHDVIDTTIVYDQGMYYRFTKNEQNSRIVMEKSDQLTGSYERVESAVLDGLEGVEGPEIYPLPEQGKWCLIVDRFKEGKGYLPLITSDLAHGEFKVLRDDQYHFGKTKKRHGGVLEISDEEYLRLKEKFLVG